jgi:nucleoid DNA-binding protein
MNKAELAQEVANQTGLTRKVSREGVEGEGGAEEKN